MGGYGMNRRNFIRNISAGGAGLFLGTAPFELLSKEQSQVITFLHTNDIHCHIEPFDGNNPRYAGKGGLARIAAYAKSVRHDNPATYLFDAGDMFQGTPYFNYYKGEPILKTMTASGYDAGTIGNHEFDNGLEGIAEPLHFAGFPLVCSNYDFSGTILSGKIPRWKVFEKGGVKVGLYGLGVGLKGLVSEKNFGNTVYNDPLAVAIEMERFLVHEQNCSLVVCLSHLGHQYQEDIVSDLAVARKTRFTDLIIGGHTHTFLDEPAVVENCSGRNVIVNQAGWGGLVIGRVDFVLEKKSGGRKIIFANRINS